ncbi:hypothetical protein GDO81_025788, partial [Engystomops pustulosus]
NEPSQTPLTPMNGTCTVTSPYAFMYSAIKEEVDSTVNIQGDGSYACDTNTVEDLIVTNPPDVCQVVEVMTESEEQPSIRAQHYPLQISPVSSCAESETDSVPSDEEGLSRLKSHKIVENKDCVRTSSPRALYNLPSMATFVTSNKPDLQVTIKEETCPMPYNASWPIFSDGSAYTQTDSISTLSSIRKDHETRATVIKKTSDITQPRLKTF